MDRDAKDKQEDPQRDSRQRPSSTSPPGGKTHEATKPPAPGDLDEEAAAKSREKLDLAAGSD